MWLRRPSPLMRSSFFYEIRLSHFNYRGVRIEEKRSVDLIKNILFQILKLILYPLLYCRQVILDAPIICCDNQVIGFGEYSRLTGSGETASDHASSHPTETGWVCHAR